MFDPPLWNKEMIHNCDAPDASVNNLWGGVAKFLFLLTCRGMGCMGVNENLTN